MQSKLKVLSVIIIVLFLLCLTGAIYYAHAAGFDNKKQYKSALSYYDEGNYQEAYVNFIRIKIFSKYHRAALFKQILAAEKLGDWAVVESKAKNFINRYPGTTFSARAEYLLAKSYYMNKKYHSATTAFEQIKKTSIIEDYQYAADYFLGKISFNNNQFSQAKKYYFDYLNNAPSGTYSLAIAYDAMDMALVSSEAVKIAKIFLANQKYDETIVVLKDLPKINSWTYIAMAYYYKSDYEAFKKLVSEGYSSMVSGIIAEDLKDFTNFYLSIQADYKKSLDDLKKSAVNKVIPDYFIYKSAQFMPEDKKIEQYKEIVKKYPKSEYIPDCLVAVFFDFANHGMYNSAIKIGNIFLEKFPDNPQCSQILFWTGKYHLKIQKKEEAKFYFTKVMDKYPDSYYAYRASKLGMTSLASWSFSHIRLPDSSKFEIEFPFDEINSKDAALIKLFFELGDKNIVEEIPLNNYAVKSWCEFKKGNAAKSTFYANKYITESGKKIPYSRPVWKLAFPIYYSDYINENCGMRNLDPFLILSLIREESHFMEDARSSSNALGLMQLLMPTAAYIAEMKGIEAPDDIKLKNPQYNIAVGSAYFSYVLETTDNNTMFAIGGYNGGPNAMNKWREKYKTNDTDEFVEKIPYAESKNYIKKVFRSRYNYAKIYEAY